jgi:hypothetical protein
VAIVLNPMPPKIIRIKVYLWAKNPFQLSKDPRPKGCPNTSRKEKSKEMKDSMKMEK